MVFEVPRKEILALMPFNDLSSISGTPMYHTTTKLKKELGANLIAVNCPWRMGKVHLGLLQDLTTFTVQNGGPYIPPVALPPVYSNIPAGA